MLDDEQPELTAAAVPTQRTSRLAPAPVRRARPASPPPAARTQPPAPPPVAPAPVVPVPATLGRGLRAALVLAFVLLAAAAGLGAAAVVESRPATWEASTVVALAPAPGVPDPAAQVAEAQARYVDRVNAAAFTALSTFQAGLREAQVRRPVLGQAVGTDRLRLVVRASSRAATRELVAAAGRSLVDAVRADQLLEAPAVEKALSAQVQGAPSAGSRLEPQDRDALVAGLLSGGVLLLLGGVGALLRRISSTG